VVTPPFEQKRSKALLALAAAGALLAFSSARPLDIDLTLRATSGHALIRFGFASIKFVFDSGRECSNPNGCAAPIL
jgi:hypothetical protein